MEFDDLKYEEVRLNTFTGWPANAKVEAWKMAKAGLTYTGQSEAVKCIFCGCILADWQYGDQVMTKHRRANPGCPFVQNQSNNVPLVVSGPSSAQQQADQHMQEQGRTAEETDDTSVEDARIADVSDTNYRSGSSLMDTSNIRSLREDMRSEASRLATFSNWTLPFIRPSDLARAGFYYVNQRDNCRCAFCDNFVGDWEVGDVPMEEHTKLFPLCGFVRGLEVGNLSIERVEEERPSTSRGSPGHDETGIRFNMRPNSRPEKGFPCSQSESLGIISHHGPIHPPYATLEARLKTFREWPPALKQQPQELADAGFYYIGLSDQVKCFYCDGGLRNWQPEDDPWVEHARWFTKCAFVRLRKGEDFIKSCIESRPPDDMQEPVSYSRVVTEEDIRAVMSEAIVKQVLSMGIDHTRVKMAIKKQLENYGSSFDTPEHLINAAFSVQREQERRVQNELNNPSGAVLGGGRRSFDEVTSRHWEQATRQEYENSTEDEDEIPNFSSLPAGVNLNRNAPSATAVAASTPAAATATAAATTVAAATAVASITANAAAAAAGNSGEAAVAGGEGKPAATSPLLSPSPVKAADLSLEVENARLKEQKTCKVCMDGEVGVVFLPCGHLICCVNCAPSLKDCPVCRTTIQGTVRTFMS